MGKRIKKLKKIRLHREGTDQLLYGGIGIALVAAILWFALTTKIPFWAFLVIMVPVYCIVLNFYRCPIRYLNIEDTEHIVVAPADGKIVVIEEVEENEYFHDRRLMISIFMSLFNVHANWFPVDGVVKFVKHFNGNFHKAWLPKASEENEHADVAATCSAARSRVPWRVVSSPMPRMARTATSTSTWASSSSAAAWTSICLSTPRSV